MPKFPNVPNFAARLAAARLGRSREQFLLLEEFRRPVTRCAALYADPCCSSLQDEHDLAQEVMICAQAKFDQFRGSTPEELTGWLVIITRHTACDTGRRWRGRFKEGEQPARRDLPLDAAANAVSRERTPPEVALSREEEELLATAFGELNEHQQEIWRHLMAGLSSKRAGALLGMGEEAMQSARRRVIADMIEKVGGGTSRSIVDQ